MVRFHTGLTPLLVDIDTIGQHPLNPNNGDVEAIEASIEINGFFAPIGVQRSTGYIVDGNHRYAALLAAGETKAPVVYLDLDDEEAVRVMIAANALAQKARMDEGSLLALIGDKRDDALALVGYGLTLEDVSKMEQALAATPIPDAHGYAEPIPTGITCPKCGHTW